LYQFVKDFSLLAGKKTFFDKGIRKKLESQLF